MDRPATPRQHYAPFLEHIKSYFPAPVSDPLLDGYFVHTVSRFLDQVDDLKTRAPLLGLGRRSPYQARRARPSPRSSPLS
ncbi:MAG: hypothetical protein JRI59_07505 [Deltaproteobacteria bacterium]|nr:hypothetical protein [Deltaproteobacteria bacterium]